MAFGRIGWRGRNARRFYIPQEQGDGGAFTAAAGQASPLHSAPACAPIRYHQQRRAPRDAWGLARTVRDIGGLAIRVHPGTDAGPGVSGAHRDAEPVRHQQRPGPISNRLGGKINERALTWVNRICGIVITLYGLKLLSTLVQL